MRQFILQTVLTGVVVLFQCVSVHAELVTDLNASIAFTTNFTGDRMLTVDPNYDGSDETFAAGGFNFTTDIATLWNWEISGSITTADSITTMLTIDDNTSGEVRFGTIATSDVTTFKLTGTATWDGVPPGGASWTLIDPQTLQVTNLSAVTLSFGNAQNPTWTGDADVLTMTNQNLVLSPSIVMGYGVNATFLTAVPEPSAALFCFLGFCGLMLRRGKRKESDQ